MPYKLCCLFIVLIFTCSSCEKQVQEPIIQAFDYQSLINGEWVFDKKIYTEFHNDKQVRADTTFQASAQNYAARIHYKANQTFEEFYAGNNTLASGTYKVDEQKIYYKFSSGIEYDMNYNYAGDELKFTVSFTYNNNGVMEQGTSQIFYLRPQ